MMYMWFLCFDFFVEYNKIKIMFLHDIASLIFPVLFSFLNNYVDPTVFMPLPVHVP